jgi:hypothetical protein
MRHFSPEDEVRQAKKYKALALRLERRHSTNLAERFTILAALSEEKALILQEIDDLRGSHAHEEAHEAHLHQEFIDWALAHLHEKHRKSTHN